MKLKRILSALISSAMAFSAVAMAATAPAPTADVSVVRWEDATTAEWLLSNWDQDYIDEGYGMYEVTFDLDNLGTLSHKASKGKTSGTKFIFAQAAMEVDSADACADFVWTGNEPESSLGNTYVKLGYATKWNGFALYYSNIDKGAYPSTSTTIENASVEGVLKAYIYAPDGTVLECNADNSFIQTQVFVDNNPSGEPVKSNFVFDDIVLDVAGGDDEEVLTFAIAEGTIYENGTVWACTIANAVNGLASLSATVTAENGAEKTFGTSNLSAWGGAGATEFNIGINTAKAGVVANAIEATITDGNGATATDSASAVAAN